MQITGHLENVSIPGIERCGADAASIFRPANMGRALEAGTLPDLPPGMFSRRCRFHPAMLIRSNTGPNDLRPYFVFV